ncbi:MAG: nucleoside diphosphate kinase regulator [Gammaproteobacteria bacterium]
MKTHPPITVSDRDYERLERLLDNPSYKNLPGIAALRVELDRAEIVDPEKVPPGVITMNSTARFVDEETGDEHEMTLVYPPDADGSAGKVSILAPVGSALLGLSVGQTIEWPLPSGRKAKLRVLDVTYQPEAAGEFHR